MDIVLVVWAAAALAMLCCGLYDLHNIFSSIAWLRRAKEPPRSSHVDKPFIIILLPVLREQRLIADTLDALAKLHYPLQRLYVFVITTEKELAQKKEAQKRLTSLAHDIATKRLATPLLLEKYLGVFPEDALKKMLARASCLEHESDILSFLGNAFEAYPTTIDVVSKHVALLNAQAGMAVFVHLHYPSSKGNMGQQLKYGCEQLPLYLDDLNIPRSQVYLAVYNADSRPHIDTLQRVATQCSEFRTRYRSCPPVMQQCAVYLKNESSADFSFKSLLLQSCGILQTRFVLSHELPRLRRQSQSAHEFKFGKPRLHQRLLGSEFALCVGHGLFIRYDVVERLNNFSVSEYSDDLLWSFRLCIDHVPILPLSLLEAAESPSTFRSLILQKKNWFLGYTEFFQSRAIALQEGRSTRSAIEFVTFHGLLRAVKWLLLSPTIFLAFALPILEHSWQLLSITLVIFALYGFLTYTVILRELKMLKERCGGNWSPFSFSLKHKVWLVLFSLPAFLLESLGLWWCLFQSFRHAFTGVPIVKTKTER